MTPYHFLHSDTYDPFFHKIKNHIVSNARSARKSDKGFTLVEMLVATALFVIVMLVSVNTLLALVQANRKAQSLQSVIENLNVSLDSMEREIRMGTNFHCGISPPYNSTNDCPNGDTVFAFEPYGNLPTDIPYVYRLNGTQIEKSENGGIVFSPITAPEISIDRMRFYVVGSTPGCRPYPCTGNTDQPRVVVVIKGTAPIRGGSAVTPFHIQITAVQRVLDI